jgi:hypothetical protein
MWKLNLLMYVDLGCVFMYVAGRLNEKFTT